MKPVPSNIRILFAAALAKKGMERSSRFHYLKWLRYYLDFCLKYHCAPMNRESLGPFLKKLKDKQQSAQQRKQASDAVSLFYQLKKVEQGETHTLKDNKGNISTKKHELKKRNADWNSVYNELNSEIKLRHYSPKTLQAYRGWVRQLQGFVRSKDPQVLSAQDVKDFLTYLAVDRKVSASSQNQAFNALLFFYRHVLKTEFGDMKDIPRAKRKPYIPTVLSREEVDAIITRLRYPYNLVVKLLYGCGLRLSECLRLRVQDINFDTLILTVHDGKGKKDRTVPLPETILPELKTQLETVITLHQKDLEAGYAGTFLVGLLEKNIKMRQGNWSGSGFFPLRP